jgi:hypothetical protein
MRFIVGRFLEKKGGQRGTKGDKKIQLFYHCPYLSLFVPINIISLNRLIVLRYAIHAQYMCTVPVPPISWQLKNAKKGGQRGTLLG